MHWVILTFFMKSGKQMNAEKNKVIYDRTEPQSAAYNLNLRFYLG